MVSTFVSVPPSSFVITPAKFTLLTPFPFLPSVLMYEISITFPLSNLAPKIPSPNRTSYFSSAVSYTHLRAHET